MRVAEDLMEALERHSDSKELLTVVPAQICEEGS